MIGTRGENLIFLLSQPRSGSTMLQRVLAGHPEIHTTAEPWIALAPCLAAGTPGLAKDALDDYVANLPGGMASYWTAAAGFLRELYNSALYRSDRGDSGPKKKFLDKTPRYYSILPELKTMFPLANYIILLRNPAAVFASVAEAWGGENLSRMGNFHQDLYAAPGQLLWGMKNLPNPTILHYEAFVQSPVPNLERIFQALELHPRLECLNYRATKVPAGRMGDHKVNQFTQPVTESLDRWQRLPVLLRDATNQYLDNLDAQVSAELGYPIENIRAELNRF